MIVSVKGNSLTIWPQLQKLDGKPTVCEFSYTTSSIVSKFIFLNVYHVFLKECLKESD